MISPSSICVGTANFGKKYGKYNNSILSQKDIIRILGYCKKNKINSLDTSFSYNNHKIIGLLKPKNWRNLKINTKLPQKLIPSEKKLFEFIETALNDLKLDKLNILYFHGNESLSSNSSEEFFNSLKYLKKTKKITKIGISLYKTDSISKILNKFDFDVLQIPFNFADQTILNKDKLKKISDRNIEIHIRSIFLQGALVSKKLYKYKSNTDLYKYLISVSEKISQINIDNYNFALNFISRYNFYNKVIIGINNLSHLENFCNFEPKKLNINYNELSSNNEKIIYPYNWY